MVIVVMEMLDACERRDDGGDRGSGYWWLAWLPGVPVSALCEDLVMERPLGHIVQLQSIWHWLG
jgi:hypothetical protein